VFLACLVVDEGFGKYIVHYFPSVHVFEDSSVMSSNSMIGLFPTVAEIKRYLSGMLPCLGIFLSFTLSFLL
jgi:hypothetical protein